MKQIYETDWLASQPVFYHEKTGKVSHNVNDVIDFANLEFHPEGFNNYLDFGYSVLEQTPVKYVKFLRHSSRLTVHENGSLEVEYLDDPVEKWFGKTSNEDDILHLLHTNIRDWENSVEGEIIIPTSGGYDSRILNFFIENKSRVRSFTYGLSETQSESFEVVHARKLSEIFGTRWEQIPLGNFHQYFDDWDSMFGISTHAHGMYHIEFYQKMLPKITGGNNPFLSGIFGDVWAGNVCKQDISSFMELKKIGYTHGLNCDLTQSKLSCEFDIRENYWTKNNEYLQDDYFQIINLIRLKMILISYLITVPQHFGFQVWSPFLDPQIALSMLTLPESRRRNRLWQKEFFNKHRLDLESMNLKVSHQNNLNHQAMRQMPVSPLNTNLLQEVVKPSYIKWINFHVAQQGKLWDWFWNLRTVPKLGGLMWRLGVREQRLSAYCAYLTLKPIENLLKKRNKAQGL